MICTKCGLIMDESDAQQHVCKIENIPQKGKPKQPVTNEITNN